MQKTPSQRQVFLLVFLALSCLFLILPSVDAIGIRPPRASIDFEPETRYDFSVTVINDKEFAIDVETRAEGMLAPYIAVRQPIRIAAKSTAVVPVSVITPTSIPRPGRHTTYIYFTEKFIDTKTGTIAARTGVGFSLVVWEPYPGRYAEIVASATSVPEGEDTALKVLVNNLGTEPIVDGRATVRILAPDGALQEVFTFPNLNVPGDTNQDYYELIPSSGYNPGKYTIEGRLEYGANSSNSTSSFAVGIRDIDILALEGPLYLDKPVNRYTVHVESLWNEPMDNVYATVQIGTGTTQTVSSSLASFGSAALTGFWETDGSVTPGQVLARINVTFPGGSREELLPVMVEATTPKPPQPPTYEEPASGIIELSMADIAMLFLALLVLVLLAIWGIGKLKDRQQPPKTGTALPLASEKPVQGLPGPPKNP